jgi:hypothetical protein
MATFTLRTRAAQEWVKTDSLPRYVRKKTAKGRTYFYFDTGKVSADGKPILTPLPAPGTAGYVVQLKKARLARWKHFTRVIPVIEPRYRPPVEFDPAVLELEPPADGDDLYFVRCRDAVKIGRATDVFPRLVQIQAHNPVDVDCLCRLPGRGFEERQWHAYFRDLWIRGEWFEWVPELAAAVELARKGEKWWSDRHESAAA